MSDPMNPDTAAQKAACAIFFEPDGALPRLRKALANFSGLGGDHATGTKLAFLLMLLDLNDSDRHSVVAGIIETFLKTETKH